MTRRALEGLRVLDLSQLIAGPFGAKLLGDYGADVIKIEHPAGGDPSRRAGPFPGDLPHPERSGLFLAVNTSKRGITLDPSTATGGIILKRLARDADVLIESFRPGTMEDWGLGADALREINPRLVYCSVTNFGQTGPYRDWAATELIFQAMSAFMYGCGDPEREPLWIPIYIAQQVAGLYAFLASLAAQRWAKVRDRGLRVDISIHEAMMELQDVMLTAYAYSGYVRHRLGARRASSYPSSIRPTKDGALHVNASTEREWRDLASLIGMPELIDDPRFATEALRRKHADELDAILAPWLMAHTTEEAYRLTQGGRVTCAAVLAADGIMRSAQLAARAYFRDVDHPVAGTFTYPGPPFPMSKTPATMSAAPTLGQHNDAVYEETLGYAGSDLTALRMAGVI